jgi:uncharacterized protein involved in response to NO
MDAIKIIEKLAKTAQREKVPQIDVSKAVMHEIGILQRESVSFLPFEWFAGVSAVAASIMMFLSFYAWQYMTNPLVQLFAPFQEILPW